MLTVINTKSGHISQIYPCTNLRENEENVDSYFFILLQIKYILLVITNM